METLPEDVLEILHGIRRYDLAPSHLDDMANAALQKYGIKSLASAPGSLKWDRQYYRGDGTDAFLEQEYRGGVDGIPWPEIEGIDPRDLINDGWIVQKWCEVPEGHEIAMSLTRNGKHMAVHAMLDQHDHKAVIVFCRPPNP